jgi:hypothetical protein
MKILRVKKTPFYDIFLGSGWFNHTRVLVTNNIVHFHSGKHLTRIQMVEIAKTVGDMK